MKIDNHKADATNGWRNYGGKYTIPGIELDISERNPIKVLSILS